jgi:hypothetical protein
VRHVRSTTQHDKLHATVMAVRDGCKGHVRPGQPANALPLLARAKNALQYVYPASSGTSHRSVLSREELTGMLAGRLLKCPHRERDAFHAQFRGRKRVPCSAARQAAPVRTPGMNAVALDGRRRRHGTTSLPPCVWRPHSSPFAPAAQAPLSHPRSPSPPPQPPPLAPAAQPPRTLLVLLRPP